MDIVRTDYILSGILHPGMHVEPGQIGIVKSAIIPRGSVATLRQMGVSASVPLKITFSIEKNGVNRDIKIIHTSSCNLNYESSQEYLTSSIKDCMVTETRFICTIQNKDDVTLTLPYVYFNYRVEEYGG